MKYDEFGREIPDDTPLEVPVNFRRPPSIQELIALHVRAAMQVERAMGADDEEDFEEGDERDDILTPYELHAMAGEADLEFRRAKQSREVLERLRKKKENIGAVNVDREKGDDNGGRKGSGVHGEGNAGDSERAGDGGEKRGASGGERRSAGKRGSGVSEGDEGDR